jgi:PAS domain S-box-containing protein
MSPKTRFENLLEAVPDALVGMDQKGVIRFVNRQTELLFGCDREELIGQPIDVLVPESLWQIYAEHRQGYFADPRTRSLGLELELSGRQRDGTEFPINISLSSIETGDVLLVITAVRDVNQRNRAVHAAALGSAIIEYSDDAIISMTLDGIITSWNPAAERLYGYSSKEVIGRSGEFLLREDRAGELNAILSRIKDGQVVEDAAYSVIPYKDGTVVPISITVSPIRDVDGEVVGLVSLHRDVTAQRQALETAQRMAAIVENSDDAIFGRALDGIITSWNTAAERMFGYSSAEILGRSADLLVPKDRARETDSVVDKVKAGQRIEHLETIRVRRNGTVFPVSLTVSPICDEGSVVGASVICRDVSEVKHAAVYARSLIEAAPDPLMMISPQGKITDVNEATVKATGAPRDALIGTDFSGYFTDPHKAREGYQRVFAQESVADYPLTLRHRDGTLTEVLYNASVYRDTGGNILGVLAAARDMTTQKDALETAQRLAAIVESSDDAIIGRTIDGIITSWNPAAAKMFGYSSKEIVGKHIGLLIPADRGGEMISILAKVSAGHPVHNFETLRIRKDGTVFPVSLTISPIRDQKGTVVAVSVICRDVTDMKYAAQYARSLIEAALDPMVTISPEGLITDVNEATVKVTGVPRNKLIGTSFSTYFTDPDRAHEVYQKVFAQGSVTDYPLTLRHRDGTLSDVQYNASVYRDTGGNVLGVLAAARDMTTQKEGFEAAQRMAAIVKDTDDAIISNTLDGIITSWNPAAERMFGYSSDEIVGQSGSLLSPKDRTDEIKTILARVSAGRPVDNVETLCTRKDGTMFPVKLTLTPIRDARGAIVGASAIARDVYSIARGMTEQK